MPDPRSTALPPPTFTAVCMYIHIGLANHRCASCLSIYCEVSTSARTRVEPQVLASNIRSIHRVLEDARPWAGCNRLPRGAYPRLSNWSLPKPHRVGTVMGSGMATIMHSPVDGLVGLGPRRRADTHAATLAHDMNEADVVLGKVFRKARALFVSRTRSTRLPAQRLHRPSRPVRKRAKLMTAKLY
ncbi:hypothetical protein BT67DRAFT_93694 [Trichocladium antarcticum]|uniref:Uncharacterized protein n=1 Tax=Trichocladium antarcticum TaxID=1450529 RepID=A0AAN6UFT1_9PEZI|nr:hypothetical protein BT67DRAFT_93694 [Trichocladium antarcticum]